MKVVESIARHIVKCCVCGRLVDAEVAIPLWCNFILRDNGKGSQMVCGLKCEEQACTVCLWNGQCSFQRGDEDEQREK